MALILACSPRRDGNCDTAAGIVREAGREAASSVLALRDYSILPCVSCGQCRIRLGTCPLRDKDASAVLFEALRKAPRLVLVAPVYFYHLPAQFKALIDRSQPWWFLRENGTAPSPEPRNAYPILVGARHSGGRLFEGSLLTLRFWLDLFGYALAEPLMLYGLDGPDDLAGSAAHRETVARYAREIVFGL